MIVVIGSPWCLRTPDGPIAAGRATAIAVAAARAGASVQLVGKVGADAAGDEVILSLGRSGVSHVALGRVAGLETPVVDAETSIAESPTAETPIAAPSGGEDRRATPLQPVATPPLEAADLDLALRYLTDFAVVVVAEPLTPGAWRPVIEAVGWAGARLIAVVDPGAVSPDLPDDAIALEAPAGGADEGFSGLVGAYAAALDGGTHPEAAFRDLAMRLGLETVPG